MTNILLQICLRLLFSLPKQLWDQGFLKSLLLHIGFADHRPLWSQGKSLPRHDRRRCFPRYVRRYGHSLPHRLDPQRPQFHHLSGFPSLRALHERGCGTSTLHTSRPTKSAIQSDPEGAGERKEGFRIEEATDKLRFP